MPKRFVRQVHRLALQPFRSEKCCARLWHRIQGVALILDVSDRVHGAAALHPVAAV
jgi:hypothetical protein